MAEKKRARNKKGEFVGDDPSTLDINEAYQNIEGKFVEKKTKKSKKPRKHKLSKKKEEKYLTLPWVGVAIGIFLIGLYLLS